jgi:carnitine 3-dehydrogenase
MSGSALPSAAERLSKIGLLGGGVIGGGWAARFVLNGADAQVFDPDPDAPRKLDEVLANARRAFGRLTLTPLPAEGTVTFVGSAEEAAEGVELVQESAPERLDLKRTLLQAASRAASPDTLLCSSTSGLLPTELQDGLAGPERFVVAHPFNPVYLLPLVELCGGKQTAPETISRAAAAYEAVGMHPLVVRNEIDGFIADRLLEALWREALWLVNDDVATVTEIDDAISYGAGLRFALMGTFLTYRIAGGEAGMRHFLAQFGPALQWPWTKLMDVPELTDELVEKVTAQSDAQATGRSIRELEQQRDDCLVAILQGLRAAPYGAGETLAAWERGLLDGRPSGPARVPADWVDYNGHVHESRYLQLFGDATDALLRSLGVDEAYLARGTYMTAETHLSHLGQLHAGDEVSVTTQVLAADEKRLHLFHTIVQDGVPAATAEQMLLHVDAASGRVGPAGEEVRERVALLAAEHAALPRPERAGRRIGG